MNILISGGTGFIGVELCKHLLKNHEIVVKTRHPESIDTNVKSVESLNEIDSSEVFDIVINLAGEPIVDKRWS